MTGPYVLDTNALLALVRGRELGAYIDSKFGLSTAKQHPAISVVTHGEIHVLAQSNNWGERKLDALALALEALITIDINNAAVINAYVELDLYSQGHPDGARNMGKNDLWIAACAKAAGYTLLTTDKDFGHLHPKLMSVEYVDPKVGSAHLS